MRHLISINSALILAVLLGGVGCEALGYVRSNGDHPADSEEPVGSGGRAVSAAGGVAGAAVAGAGGAGGSSVVPNAGGAGAGQGGLTNTAGSTTGGTGGTGDVVSREGCKRGVAWASSQATNAALRPNILWWYNWGNSAEAIVTGLEFVPMVWGGGFDVAGTVGAIPAGAEYLLGFNEPNFHDQANMSAADAAALWPGIESIAQQRGLDIVSPAVNFCGDDATKTGDCHDTNPFDYLTDFFAQCAGCKVDAVAVHWYNCDGESLAWYLGEFKKFGRPIWLTEFACAYGGDTSPQGQEAYMRVAVPLLEADPDIARYAWFSGDPIPNARLLDASGALTALGQVYVSLAHNPECAP